MAHSHNHGTCQDHAHEEDESPEMGIEYSLYTKIDFNNLECLNESVEQSGRSVFKAWENRLDLEKYVESDVDEELLFNIPFIGNVKLKGIIIVGGEDEMHPSQVRIFKNRPGLAFDDMSSKPEQEFELYPDHTGRLEYPLRIAKFSGVYHLSLHFPKNFGAGKTKVYYIGLRGEYSDFKRHEVTICTYEVTPSAKDICNAKAKNEAPHIGMA